MAKVNLGDEVQCLATGLKGLAVSRTKMLHGEDQIGIQPPVLKSDPGKIPDGGSIDEHLLKVTEAGKGQFEVKKPHAIELALGDEAVDDVTGAKGIVTQLTYFANGCVYARIKPKLDKDGKDRDSVFASALRFKRTSKPKPEADEPRRTGGPNNRLERRI